MLYNIYSKKGIYYMNREFVLMSEFDRAWNKLGLTDEDLQFLQTTIMNDPTIGPVIPGTNGLRKLRIAFPNRGKSGSGRVCYVDFVEAEVTYLITIYAKNEQENISKSDANLFAKLITKIKNNLKEGVGTMNVRDSILRGLQEAVEYSSGNKKVGRSVRINIKSESLKLHIKESFTSYDANDMLARIESKWGSGVMNKMLDWLADHSDNANDQLDDYGYYDVSEFEFWIDTSKVEQVMRHCLDTGKVEEL